VIWNKGDTSKKHGKIQGDDTSPYGVLNKLYEPAYVHEGPLRIEELEDCEFEERDLKLMHSVLSSRQTYFMAKDLRQAYPKNDFRPHIPARELLNAFTFCVKVARRFHQDKLPALEERQLH
jgi:hypothetical protein